MLTKLKSLFGKQDLTSGNPSKGILVFLIPILLSTIFQQLYTLTDAAIVGQSLAGESVAAINASASVHYLVLNFGMGATSGFSVILSKYVGAKNLNEARRSFLTQCILCVFVSIFLTIAGIALIPAFLQLLHIYNGSGDPSMQMEFDEAVIYMTYLFSGSLLVVFYNMSMANLRAKGDSFMPFVFLAFGVLLNIGLDVLFIRAFHWGVAGSALATVLSEGVACVLSLIYGARKYEEFRFDFKNAKPTLRSIGDHLKNGIPLGFQYSVLGFGIIAMTSGVIRFDINPDQSAVPGLPAQLGYGTACKLINLLLAPFGALGTAMISYVSQNYGAGRFDRIKIGIKSAIVIGLVLTLLMNAIGLPLLINGFYQYLFLSSEKVTEQSIYYGNVYLFLSIPTLLFLMFLFIFRGVLQGLEKPLFPFIGGVSELFARILACSLLPYWIFGSFNSASPQAAYFIVASGDWFAWLVGALSMMVPTIYYLKKYLKTNQSQK